MGTDDFFTRDPDEPRAAEPTPVTAMADRRKCHSCGQDFDRSVFDGCPECGAIALRAYRHITEIRNVLAALIVIGLVLMLLNLAGYALRP